MKFDPESYTITIRKEEDEGEILYVGRVAEFPNISVFEDTFEAARTLILDSIRTLKNIADETQAEFPLPYPRSADDFSGRVTLRLPKSLHAKVSRLAAQEDISVNLYLVTAISTYVGETDGISRVVSDAITLLNNIVTHAWKSSQFTLNDIVTPASLAKRSAFGEMKYIEAPTIRADLFTVGEMRYG